jgi:hypothetical protein
MTRPTAWCLAALAVFQLLIALLLLVNWDSTVDSFAGKAFAPTRDAAEGAALGSLGVHVVLAVLYVVFALNIRRRWARVRATVLLAVNVVLGVVTLFAIPDATSLNPVGIVLAVAALVLLWGPSRVDAPR